MTRGYRGLQMGDKGLQGVIGGYRGLQGDSEGLQGITRGYRGFKRVRRG